MITTRLTEMFNLHYPIVLAPMGGVSGGALAAAVSNAGGLGLIGGGYGDPLELEQQLTIAAAGTDRPWGIGFISWSLTPAVLELALSFEPSTIMLSFGDVEPWTNRIRAAGVRLICQVQDVAGACSAAAAGAEVIVAQGTEAGGHGAARATFPLVPAVTEAVAPIPTLAAGGIADGRGLAAALMLGADGVSIGTRFFASAEARAPSARKDTIVRARGDQTVRTSVFDIVRGRRWPAGYTGRSLTNDFTARWHGREDALRRDLVTESGAYWKAEADEDYRHAVVWAGECVDLVDSVRPAGEIVEAIGHEAEQLLARAGNAVSR